MTEQVRSWSMVRLRLWWRRLENAAKLVGKAATI